MIRAMLKMNAKEQLRGKWALAVHVSFISSFITISIQTIFGLIPNDMFNFIGIVLSVYVNSAMSLGLVNFFLGLKRGGDVKLENLFDGFRIPAKAIGLYLLMSLYIFLWSLLFIIPGIVAAYRYRQAWYILVDNPQTKVSDAIRESKELMRGKKFDLFVLDLSFLGWGMLATLPYIIITQWLVLSDTSLLNLSINSTDIRDNIGLYGENPLTIIILMLSIILGIIWLIPYTTVTYANYYDLIKGNNNEVVTNNINFSDSNFINPDIIANDDTTDE